jgi:uncharacterized protein (DUF1800 family)
MLFKKIATIASHVAVALLFTGGAIAQDDPDPNSPMPVLVTRAESIRALAQYEKNADRVPLSKIGAQAFRPDTRIVVYVRGLQFTEDEGANSVRLYAEDVKGRTYRLPVRAVRPADAARQLFAVVVEVSDEIGYWGGLPAQGDVLIYATWRGLATNKARLGIGRLGGDIKDPEGSRPMPLDDKAPQVFVPEIVGGYRWSGDRFRFMEQATFGPTLALDNRLRRIGLRMWLNEQFQLPYPSQGNPFPNQPLKPANAPADCDNEQTIVPDVPPTCFRDTYSMYQPQTWFFREAFYGDAQLRHRVAWALMQIWVTSGAGGEVQQGRHMVEYYKLLARHAFGNYRDLMKDVTLHPTMGTYLDMAISTRTNPNENYARELMQLFSIGLFMLNEDGTLQMDNGSPIPTYDQNVVNDLTKVLTGWSFCSVAAACPNLAVGTVNFIDPMLLNSGVTNLNNNRHDLTAKTLLSYPGSTTTSIAACSNCTSLANISTYANNSLERALDNIYNHPNVGPFVGKILIQHLVTSDPSPAYVARVAQVFNENRSNPNQMREVIRAILLDPEARGDVKTDPNFGKLREPVQFVTNLFRTFNVRSANGTGLSDGYLTGRGEFTGMAQIPFQAPTVFNFYPPDYVVPGTSMLGPEFAILTTNTTVQRANFVYQLVFSTIPVSANGPNGTSLDLAELQALAAADTTGNRLVDELNRKMLNGTMSPAVKNTILTAVTNIASSNPSQRARQALYLVATSSQYQVQR